MRAASVTARTVATATATRQAEVAVGATDKAAETLPAIEELCTTAMSGRRTRPINSGSITCTTTASHQAEIGKTNRKASRSPQSMQFLRCRRRHNHHKLHAHGTR